MVGTLTSAALSSALQAPRTKTKAREQSASISSKSEVMTNTAAPCEASRRNGFVNLLARANINTDADVVYDQHWRGVEQPSRHEHFLRVSAAQADDSFFREGRTDSKTVQNSAGIGTLARVRERPQTADGR